MPWRRSQVWLGFKAGWRDGRGDPVAVKAGAALGIVAGLAFCLGIILS
ncbi:hypothetical protein [Brevundimonas sp.]